MTDPTARKPGASADGRPAVASPVAMGPIFLLSLFFALPASATELTLWHVYRDQEKTGFEELVDRFNDEHPDLTIRPQALPFGAFSAKLRKAIPHGRGPDLFIYNHDQIGGWVDSGLLHEVQLDEGYFHAARDGVTYEDSTWAFPFACKNVALFYDRTLVDSPPNTREEMVDLARELTDDQVYGLAYEATNFYNNAGWFLGAGGQFFDDSGAITLATPAMEEMLAFAQDAVQTHRITPEEATSVLVAQLFNDGRAAMVISGPWFLAEIDDDVVFGVAPLPAPGAPLLTVESIFVPTGTAQPDEAMRAAKLLAGREYEELRVERARQVVARRFDYPDPVQAAFAWSIPSAQPTPNRARMALIWEPANAMMRKVLRGAATPAEGAVFAQRRAEILSRPLPPRANPWPTLLLLGLLCLGGAVYAVHRSRRDRIPQRMWEARPAYAYLAPAALGMLLLLVLPFVAGSSLSLFAHRAGEYRFVGLQNFISILFARDYPVTDPLSFYFTLGVTTMWTLCNVALHVTIGMAIAMLLRDPWMKVRGIYRVLLIVPWAIPNYITALIWKGMFNKQFGAINGLLEWVGAEPVGWFSHFWTAFAANLCTNTWLGFPFMMVVTLGALQAIPRDLEEAAEVDGASRWQRFRHVVLPLLKPALLPAVILGTIWTFNQFNIVYLVSAGEPDGGTEILISEAYRWAFSREAQYGYAAAYAVLIFGVLLLYSTLTDRIGGRGKEA